MVDATGAEIVEAPKRSRKGILLAVALMLLLAGAGFYATYSGFAQGLLGRDAEHTADHALSPDAEDVAFVAIEPIAVSLPGPPARQFRIALQLEVGHGAEKDVQKLMPRVLNVLNGFLRSVDPQSLGNAAAWYDLRLKMLYRVRMVLGEAVVRDLLITEFILHGG